MPDNANGVTKLVGVVVAIIAIIIGVRNMVQPMTQTIKYQDEHITRLERFVTEHVTKDAERWSELQKDRIRQLEKVIGCEAGR